MHVSKAAFVVAAVLALEAIARPAGPTSHGSLSWRTIGHAIHYPDELEGPNIGEVMVPKPEADTVEARTCAIDKPSRLASRSAKFAVGPRSERSSAGKKRHIFTYVEVKGGDKGPPVAKAYYDTSGYKKPPVVKVWYDYNIGGKAPSIPKPKRGTASGSGVFEGTIKIRPMSTPLPPTPIPQPPVVVMLRPMPMPLPIPLQGPGSSRSTRSQGHRSEAFKAPSLNEYQRGYQRGLTRGYGEGWHWPEGRFPF